MKKVTFFLAALLIGGMMFTGCKKENPQPTPDTPAQTTKTVVYTMDNVYKDGLSSATLTVSPYFHYTFKYKDADGTMVEVNDPTGTLGSIKSGDDKTIPQNASKFHARQQFLDFISTHAERLNYSFTLSVN